MFENFPAPFLGGPLKGKDTGAAGKRNTDGAARAFANCGAYGYLPLSAPKAGATIVLDGESRTVQVDADGRGFVEVVSRKGETIAAWFGYPGSEHLMVVYCGLCQKIAAVYNSHVRRGAGHHGCSTRGKAERVAEVEKRTGQKVTAPGPQIQPNGSTPKGEPQTAAEATEATEGAQTSRATVAAESGAKRTAAPRPKPRPPKGQADNSESAPALRRERLS